MPLKKLEKPVMTRAVHDGRRSEHKPSQSKKTDIHKFREDEFKSKIQELEDEVQDTKGRPLSQEEKNVWAPEAKRLGLPIPEDLKDAVRFRSIILSEERQRKMQLEREVITRCRLPTNSFDMLLSFLSGNITRELNTVRVIFEDMPDIPESIKFTLRAKAREWVEKVLTTLSTLEIDEFTLTPTGLSIKDVTNGNAQISTTKSDDPNASEEKSGVSVQTPTGNPETGIPSYPGRDRTTVEIREQALADDDEVIVDET